jgi:hypothetical protein
MLMRATIVAVAATMAARGGNADSVPERREKKDEEEEEEEAAAATADAAAFYGRAHPRPFAGHRGLTPSRGPVSFDPDLCVRAAKGGAIQFFIAMPAALTPYGCHSRYSGTASWTIEAGLLARGIIRMTGGSLAVIWWIEPRRRLRGFRARASLPSSLAYCTRFEAIRAK